MTAPRIVLLHATPVAMDPVHAAFRDLWPGAELVNVLDDSLTADRAKEHDLSAGLTDRFVRLCHYGEDMGAAAILATCSAFGPALDQAAGELQIPVLKPNEAMFQDAIKAGSRIGMVATFTPALSTMEEEFRDEAQRAGSVARLTSIVVPEAMAALRGGDAETHNELVAERIREFDGFDAVMLAHFSTSRAAPLARTLVSTPVLTAPESAVRKLRRVLRVQGAR